MNAITQYIVNNSKLELSLIKITEATPDTFLMSIESRVTNTGATSSSISAMELDLVGPEGAFGRVNLPVIKTNSAGVDVNIASQTIKITDKTAFKAFVTAVLRNEDLVLQLKNGKGTVKAMLGLSAKIDYNKDCALKGMNGPKTSILKTEVLGGQRYRSTMRVINPSPLELDLGTIKQEIRNLDGSVIAVQQGKMYLLRGESEYVVEGMVVGKALGKDVKLVATGVEENNWHNETITAFDEPIVLTDELKTTQGLKLSDDRLIRNPPGAVAPYTPKSELEDSSLRFLIHHYVTGFVDSTVTCPGIRREWYLLAFRDPAFFNAVFSWTISHAAYFQQIELLRNFHLLRGVAIQLVGKRIRNGAHDEGTINAVVVFAQQKTESPDRVIAASKRVLWPEPYVQHVDHENGSFVPSISNEELGDYLLFVTPAVCSPDTPLAVLANTQRWSSPTDPSYPRDAVRDAGKISTLSGIMIGHAFLASNVANTVVGLRCREAKVEQEAQIGKANASAADQGECECGRGYLLDIELWMGESSKLTDPIHPRIYRQVCVSMKTTFAQLNNIINVVYLHADLGTRYMFLDPTWNRYQNSNNTLVPEQTDRDLEEESQSFLHYHKEAIRTGRTKVCSEKCERSFDADEISKWINVSEKRTHFWYFGNEFPTKYRCYLITLVGRMGIGHPKPWLVQGSGFYRIENDKGQCGNSIGGTKLWETPYNHFATLTFKELLARHDEKGSIFSNGTFLFVNKMLTKSLSDIWTAEE
ncbi:uncharacterized protein RCO7_08082 [Rhynchosporium graminicola]|uniref:Uncharacterized protein n=1 Tax=Rhynchosporium graminicola TaxID=2792576 RepID=A0A1E1K7F9_9HELO|nr:uncharacterized protein RCO7_08082 [Rhynchosporium commune]